MFLRPFICWLLVVTSQSCLHAQVSVLDVIPDSTANGCCFPDLGSFASTSLDMDGDGLPELTWQVGNYTIIDGTDTTRLQRVFVQCADSASIAAVPGPDCGSDSCTAWPIGLTMGDLVDGALPTSDTAGFLALSREAPDGTLLTGGDWLDGLDHFLGLRLLQGGLPYYAWVQLSCPLPDQVVVKAYGVGNVPNGALAVGLTAPTVAAGRASSVSASDVGDQFNGLDLRIQAARAADESGVLSYRVFAVRAADIPTFNVHVANELPPSRSLPLPPTGASLDSVFGPDATDSRGVPIQNWKPYRLIVLSVAGGPANANALSAPSGAITLQPLALSYTDLVPDDVVDGCCYPDLGSATLDSLDMDGDGRAELHWRAGQYPSLAAPVSMSWVEAGDSATLAVRPGLFCGTDSCDWEPLAFAGGDLLDASLSTLPVGGYLAAERADAGDTLRRGGWVDGQEHLFALRFTASGLNYWGWVRVLCPEPYRIEILDYAWNPFPEAPMTAGSTIITQAADRATALMGSDDADFSDGRDFRLSFTRASDESTVAAYRLMAVPLTVVERFGITEANTTPSANYLEIAPSGSNVDTVFGIGGLDVLGNPITDWNLYQAVVLSVAGGSANTNALSAPSGLVALAPAAGIGTATIDALLDLGDSGSGMDLGLQLLPANDEIPVLFYGIVPVKAGSSSTFSLADALALPIDRFLLVAPIGDTVITRFDAGDLDSDGDPITENEPYVLFARTFPRPEASILQGLSPASAAITLRDTEVTPIVVVDVDNAENASDVAVTFFAEAGIEGLDSWRLYLLRASDTTLFNLLLAQSLGPDRYTVVPAGGSTELVRLDAAQLEASTGAPIFAGFRYVVYVLAILNDPPFPANVLSGPSPVIEISPGVGLEDLESPPAHAWRHGDRLFLTLDPAWTGSSWSVFDSQGRLLKDGRARTGEQRIRLALPGPCLLLLRGTAGQRVWHLAP